MNITTMRSSSYSSWDMCQWKYFLVYCLGIPDKSGAAAEKGTIVHKCLECLANIKKTHDNKKKFFEDENLGNLHVSDYLLNNDNIALLVKKTFDYYTNPKKSINSFSKGDLNDCIKWTNIALDYGDGMFDPRLRDIIKAELYFEIPITKEWAKYKYVLPNEEQKRGSLIIKGTIDLVTKINNNIIEVIDWKSGLRIDWSNYKEKDFDRLFNDSQLRFYHYALSKVFGIDKIFIITIFYLKDGGPFTFTLDEKNLASTEKMIKERFQAIQKSTSPRRRKNGKSKFCKFCYYGKTKHCESNKSICQFHYDEFQKCGMDSVISKYSPKDFTLGDYVQG